MKMCFCKTSGKDHSHVSGRERFLSRWCFRVLGLRVLRVLNTVLGFRTAASNEELGS